jgi:serine/threonine protein kinase
MSPMTILLSILQLTYFSIYQAQSLPYNYKVDIYSLGVILFELLVPFGTDMERSCTLMDLRSNKFPAHFQQQFQQEVRTYNIPCIQLLPGSCVAGSDLCSGL